MTKIYANVLLLGNKIINWKTSTGSKWRRPSDIRTDRLPKGIPLEELSIQSKEFIEDIDGSNQEIFDNLSEDYYRQWGIHEKIMGRPPYGHKEMFDKIKMLINNLKSLDDEARLGVLSQFCCWCGCDNPECQCTNDE